MLPLCHPVDSSWTFSCVQCHDLCSLLMYTYSWMGRGIIDVPLRVIAEFLKDIENNLSWDNSLVVSTASAFEPQTPYMYFTILLGIEVCEIPFTCIS